MSSIYKTLWYWFSLTVSETMYIVFHENIIMLFRVLKYSVMQCSSHKHNHFLSNVVSVLKNPTMAIVTDGNGLLSSEHLRLSRSAVFSPEWCIFQHSAFPGVSLTWSEPLSILFIILSLVTSLLTRFVPTELFLYGMLKPSCAWGRQALQDKPLCWVLSGTYLPLLQDVEIEYQVSTTGPQTFSWQYGEGESSWTLI